MSNCDSENKYKLHGYNICYSNCNEKSLIPRFNTLTENIFSKCIENCISNDNTKNEEECTNICIQPFKFKIKDDSSNKECYIISIFKFLI